MKKLIALLMCLSTPVMAQSVYPLTEPYKYSHITTNTTTTLTGHLLHTVCINTKGASSNTLKIEDATSDTTPVVAIIDTTTAVGCLFYDAALNTGITIVTATGTAPDVTVTYR